MRGVVANAGLVAIENSYRNACQRYMRAAALFPAAKSLICETAMVTGSDPLAPCVDAWPATLPDNSQA
jgi:hypothetical protein